MGRAKRKELTLNVGPLFQHLGWDEILRQVGVQGLIDEVGMEKFLSYLTAEQRQELLRLLQELPPPEPRRRRRK